MSIKGVFTAVWSKIGVAIKWAHSILSERDGTGSASRVCFMLVTATICGVLIGHLYIKRTLPDAGTLGGLAGLLTAGATGYGANRFTNKN